MNEREGTTVVSVRIAPSLLRAVRAQARVEGRSVSGEIVSILRAKIVARPTQKRRQPVTGWLARLAVPETHTEFHEGRREASARLAQKIKRSSLVK